MLKTLTDIATELGWKPFRLQQIYRARERELKESWAAITTLSKTDREALEHAVPFDTLTVKKKVASSDGSAVKWLLQASDGASFEAVLLLHASPRKKWGTVCVSSQVGCPVGCRFCATGQMGFTRNLTSDEILDQFIIAKREAANRGIAGNLNVVFMGMGEPLLNLANVLPAIQILTDSQRHALTPSRITVSTSGIVPGLRELRAAKLGICLALSLHAPEDQLRTELMPINASYPLAEVLAELKNWERAGTDVLIEYVLIADKNDAPEQATELAKLLKGRKVKVNLIPLNPVPGSDLTRPSKNRMHAFFETLLQAGIIATLRHTKGDDIKAACGQLKTESSKQDTANS